MEEISLELERVVPVGAKAKKHNELEGLGFEESGHIGFASSEELNATKESLQSQIDTNANAIQALSEGIDPEKIDGIKDLIDYVEEHEVDVVSIQEGIEQNASDIDDLEGRVSDLEESGSSTPSGEPLVVYLSIRSSKPTLTMQGKIVGATAVDWGDGSPLEDISQLNSYTHTYTNTSTSGTPYSARFYGNITEIGSYAFQDGMAQVVGVDIPNTVTTLGNYAFYNCYFNTRVTIPPSVKSIGSRCFSDNQVGIIECLGRTPPTLQSGDRHFPVGANLQIIVPNKYLEAYKTAWTTYASQIYSYALVSELGEGGGDTEELEKRVDNLELLHQDPLVATFNISTANTAVTVKALTGATMVDWGDGSEIEDISAVTEYPHTYAEVGTYEARFYGEITTIGSYAFYQNKAITSIYIPKSVVTLGGSSFTTCTKLKFVEFAYDIKLTTILGDAFMNCYDLMRIDIPPTVTSIGAQAFRDCRCLNNIKLPISLSSNGLGRYAFANCYGLSTIVLPSRNAYDSANTALKKIEVGTFSGCRALKEIIIPDSITHIPNSAFNECHALEKVHIYFGAENIELGSAFSGCYNLKRIILDKRVGEYSNCSITLASNPFNKQQNIFSNDRILEIRSDTPPTITGINYIQDDIKIIVPKSSLELYKNAEGWKDKASQIDCEITANDVYALVGNINTELANIIEGEGV